MPQSPSLTVADGLTAQMSSSTASSRTSTNVSGAGLEETAFQEAVREILESSEEESLPFSTWTVSLPVEPELMVPSGGSGKPLPDQMAPSGETLPLRLLEGFSATPEIGKSAGLRFSGNGMSLDGLTGQINGGACAAEISTDSEFQLLAVERSNGESGTQSGLSALQVMNSVQPGRLGQFNLPVEMPVGQPAWGREIGDRIQWMLGKHVQSAEIKLTPAHLGPLEIRISVHNDQTSVNFVAAQLPTRDALEAALPRLREMLGEVNLNLVDVGVGQGNGSGSGQQQQAAGKGAHDGTIWNDSNPQYQIESQIHRATAGIVDDFA